MSARAGPGREALGISSARKGGFLVWRSSRPSLQQGTAWILLPGHHLCPALHPLYLHLSVTLPAPSSHACACVHTRAHMRAHTHTRVFHPLGAENSGSLCHIRTRRSEATSICGLRAVGPTQQAWTYPHLCYQQHHPWGSHAHLLQGRAPQWASGGWGADKGFRGSEARVGLGNWEGAGQGLGEASGV